MNRGKRKPEPMRQFIKETKRNAPGLTYTQIVDRVEARFGERVDKSTVGRILREEGLAGRDLSSGMADTYRQAESTHFGLSPSHEQTATLTESEISAAEFRNWISNNLSDATRASEAYIAKLTNEIRMSGEIKQHGTTTIDTRSPSFGAEEAKIIDAIRRRDDRLGSLELELQEAMAAANTSKAGELVDQIRLVLDEWIRI